MSKASELADWALRKMMELEAGPRMVSPSNQELASKLNDVARELRRLDEGEQSLMDFLGGENYQGKTFGEYIADTLTHKQQVIDDCAKQQARIAELEAQEPQPVDA